MTVAQKDMVKEIAGIAIGMTVDALIDQLGAPESRRLSRDMEISAESLVYPGRIFYAKNGVVYAVYAADGEGERGE